MKKTLSLFVVVFALFALIVPASIDEIMLMYVKGEAE